MSYAKQKETKVSDSNMFNYGSDEHKSVVEAAANLEVNWQGAGQEVGIQIWRVENKKRTADKAAAFGIKAWPKKDYGMFYDGDSYIILKTKKSKEGEDLEHDIFFWIGKDSTQDERGVAAYKTVELDDFLGGTPTETRIVQGGETNAFLSCFDKPPLILDGGIEGGFLHVKPEDYKPRLLHLKGKGKKVRALQIPTDSSKMNRGDCYILDAGTQLFQYNGAQSGSWEKRKAHEMLVDLRAERERGTIKMKRPIIMDDDSYEAFFEIVGASSMILPASAGGSDADASKKKKKDCILYICSDEDGSMDVEKVAEGKLEKAMLKPSDVFLIDKGTAVYVWVGSGANAAEKKESMMFAEKYLSSDEVNEQTPVVRIHEKDAHPPRGFLKCFTDWEGK